MLFNRIGKLGIYNLLWVIMFTVIKPIARLSILFLLSLTLACGSSDEPESSKSIQLDLAWAVPITPVVHRFFVGKPPTIADGKLYYFDRGLLIARDLHKGNEIWSIDTDRYGDTPRDKFIVSGNALFVLFRDELLSLDTSTGDLLWANDSLELDFLGVDKVIAEMGNHLFVAGSDRRVFRILQETGTVDLTIELPGEDEREGVPDTIRKIIISTDGFIYIALNGGFPRGGQVFCFNAVNGELVWEHNIRFEHVDVGYDASDIAILGNRIFIKGASSILALQRITGNRLWSNGVRFDSLIDSGLAPGNNQVFASSTSGDIFSFDAISGEIIWQSRGSESVKVSSLVTTENLLFFYDEFGERGMWVLDQDTGDLVWSDHLPDQGGFYGSLDVGEGYMVNVGTEHIFTFNIK